LLHHHLRRVAIHHRRAALFSQPSRDHHAVRVLTIMACAMLAFTYGKAQDFSLALTMRIILVVVGLFFLLSLANDFLHASPLYLLAVYMQTFYSFLLNATTPLGYQVAVNRLMINAALCEIERDLVVGVPLDPLTISIGLIWLSMVASGSVAFSSAQTVMKTLARSLITLSALNVVAPSLALIFTGWPHEEFSANTSQDTTAVAHLNTEAGRLTMGILLSLAGTCAPWAGGFIMRAARAAWRGLADFVKAARSTGKTAIVRGQFGWRGVARAAIDAIAAASPPGGGNDAR
jgi:hypothetical protein